LFLLERLKRDMVGLSVSAWCCICESGCAWAGFRLVALDALGIVLNDEGKRRRCSRLYILFFSPSRLRISAMHRWRTEKGSNHLAQVGTLVRSNAKWAKSVNNKE
jgi:hypothetical protein